MTAVVTDVTKNSASRLAVTALCLSVIMLEGYDIQAVGVAAPKMLPELGLNAAQSGWVFSASLIGLVTGSGLGGWFTDRVGRKPVLVGSVIAFGLLSLLTVFARDYASLVAIRVLTGLGLGGALPSVITVLAEMAPRGRSAFWTTVTFAGMPLGGAIAALFAAYALTALNWRMIFVLGGVLPVVLAPFLLRKLPETSVQTASAARIERGSLTALFDEGRAASTLVLWLSYFLIFFVLYLLLNWLPLLAKAKGLTAGMAAETALTYNLGGVPGALVWGALVNRLGLRWPMILGFAFLAAVLWGLSNADSAGAVLILSAFAGFVVIAVTYVLYGLTPSLYPPTARGTGVGAGVAVGRLGSIAGPLIAGRLLSGGWTADQVILALVPIALAAGAVLVFLTVVAHGRLRSID